MNSGTGRLRLFFALLAGASAVVTDTRADLSMLTLERSHALALSNNPAIHLADLRIGIAREQLAGARAAYLPSIIASATAASAADRDRTRIAAGGLNNPSIFERAADGVTINQMITDFGRTRDLTESAALKVKSELQGNLSTRALIVMAVDERYFDTLRARALQNVATQALATRRLILDQVAALAAGNLRSQLDVDFARVSVDEARLLVTRAANDYEIALTRLAELLGSTNRFELADIPYSPETGTPPNLSELILKAIERRPDLRKLRLDVEAARRFARAEHALHYPVISAVASAGLIPVRDESHLPIDNYAAAGVTLSLPLYAGGLHSAREREAAQRLRVAEEALRAAQLAVERDIRVASLGVASAAERVRIGNELSHHAAAAFALAEARYQAGTASMVELSQAQLNKTTAEVGEVVNRYEFEIQQRRLQYEVGALEITDPTR